MKIICILIKITFLLFLSEIAYSEDEIMELEIDEIPTPSTYVAIHPKDDYYGVIIPPPYTTSAPHNEILSLQQKLLYAKSRQEVENLIAEFMNNWDLLSPEAALLASRKGSIRSINKLSQYSLFPSDYPLETIVNYVETGNIDPFYVSENERIKMKNIGFGIHEPTIKEMPPKLRETWRNIIIQARNPNVNFHASACSLCELSDLNSCPDVISFLVIKHRAQLYACSWEVVPHIRYHYSVNLRNKEDCALILVHYSKGNGTLQRAANAPSGIYFQHNQFGRIHRYDVIIPLARDRALIISRAINKKTAL